jgi:hypothetical protein
VTDVWIVIPGWDKFQHYRDRSAPWIKDYVDQMHRSDYLNLSLSARGLLSNLRLLYLQSDCLLTRTMAVGMLGVRPRKRHWDELNHAGFIEFSASKPLVPHARPRARVEGEREAERETPLPPFHDLPIDELPPFVSRADELRALAARAPR